MNALRVFTDFFHVAVGEGNHSSAFPASWAAPLWPVQVTRNVSEGRVCGNSLAYVFSIALARFPGKNSGLVYCGTSLREVNSRRGASCHSKHAADRLVLQHPHPAGLSSCFNSAAILSIILESSGCAPIRNCAIAFAETPTSPANSMWFIPLSEIARRSWPLTVGSAIAAACNSDSTCRAARAGAAIPVRPVDDETEGVQPRQPSVRVEFVVVSSQSFSLSQCQGLVYLVRRDRQYGHFV